MKKEIGLGIVVFIMALGALVYIANEALNMPVVKVSWTTKQCVKVLPESAGTCDSLPKKYDKVWVK